MSKLKYGTGSLYRTPIWVKLDDAYIKLKPLSHKELHTINEESYLTQISTSPMLLTKRELLKDAIVGTQNIHGFPNYTILVNQLCAADVDYLYDKVMEISKVTEEQVHNLRDAIDLQFNAEYSDETWNCSVCQERKLDKSRGCGFLPEDKRDSAPFLPRVNGKRPTVCPISTVDNYIISQATMAYMIFDSGALPESGGLGEQTDWFIQAAMLYSRKVKEQQNTKQEE